MTAMVLTPVQAANFRAGGAFVVRGDPCGRCRQQIAPPGFQVVCDNHHHPKAWTVHTGPCNTCGGKGSWLEGRPTAPVRYHCPDCVGGSKIIELRERCPKHMGRLAFTEHGASGVFDRCPNCDESSGSILVARVSITVLPVVEIAPGPSVPDQVAAEVVGGSVYVVDIRAGRTFSVESGPHELDPLPQSDSDFVIVCTVEGT